MVSFDSHAAILLHFLHVFTWRDSVDGLEAIVESSGIRETACVHDFTDLIPSRLEETGCLADTYVADKLMWRLVCQLLHLPV